MDAYAEAPDKGHDSSTEFDRRDARALTEYMTVLPLGGDVYSVTTESGSEYHVDGLEGTCTCPDFRHNLPTDDGRETCKHYARVQFATGQWAIPTWVDTDEVDPALGEHTDDSPRLAATDGGDGIVVAGDDGEILDENNDKNKDENKDDGDDGRPEDCDCSDWETNSGGLPCWPCYREGFETPATED